MKKAITSICSLLLCGLAYAQTAITINATDIPMPDTSGGRYMDVTGLISPLPTPTTSGSWDYGTASSTLGIFGYYPLTDTAYTHKGINAFRSSTKHFNSAVVYNINSLLSFNSSTVDDRAVYIPKQGYDVSAYTSNPGDSLNISAQGWLFSNHRIIMKFPFTYKSAWGSISGRETDFTLTVKAAKLKNAPCKHFYYYVRYDTIVGWGKMRVYTPAGKSPYYDVLIDQIYDYAIDSFYINGSAASNTFLSAFGASQGQKTDSNFRYNFIRKGSFPYLYTTYFGNNAFVTAQNEYVVTTGVTSATNDINASAYSVVVYPNPTNGREVNVHVTGKPLSQVTYTITDLTGRSVQTGTSVFQNSLMHINLNSQLPIGNYVLSITDGNNAEIVSEEILVGRN